MPSDEHPPRENTGLTLSRNDLLVEFDGFLLPRVSLDHGQTDSGDTCRHDLSSPLHESAEEREGTEPS